VLSVLPIRVVFRISNVTGVVDNSCTMAAISGRFYTSTENEWMRDTIETEATIAANERRMVEQQYTKRAYRSL
jgi:hypothetical protein